MANSSLALLALWLIAYGASLAHCMRFRADGKKEYYYSVRNARAIGHLSEADIVSELFNRPISLQADRDQRGP
jgi:hypothetical protein